MTIENSVSKDIDEIFRLYLIATDFQRSKGLVTWPEFDRKMVSDEIDQDRQWKILVNGKIACVWASAFEDPIIWGEKNAQPSLYLHRIATNPEFRGMHMVKRILEWASIHAQLHGKSFIRMDTVGENKKLIAYYQSCGFNFLGLKQLKNTESLPAHYHNAVVSLFEIELPAPTNF
jgi:ribosomal protein S18 acetylase RimI-like enzyme